VGLVGKVAGPYNYRRKRIMQRTGRIAAAVTFSTLLIAGTVTGFMFTGGAAKASTSAANCTLQDTSTTEPSSATCNLGTETDQVSILNPLDIYVEADGTQAGGTVTLEENFQCEDDAQQYINWQTDVSGTIPTLAAANTEYSSLDFDLEVGTPLNCEVYVTASDTSVAVGDVITMNLEYDPNPDPVSTVTAAPTPTATASKPAPVTVHQVHGFDGTCVDDFGNSSAERTKIGIWTCSPKDAAQSWTYSGDELHIHGMCINAKGSGKSGSKLILWKCTGAGNEVFVHNSKQEYVEKAGGWKYCVDDPAYSTKNGTQLFVYTCNNGPNQHWSLP
jgi:Ricin-type beta-trefoil lectin domain